MFLSSSSPVSEPMLLGSPKVSPRMAENVAPSFLFGKDLTSPRNNSGYLYNRPSFERGNQLGENCLSYLSRHSNNTMPNSAANKHVTWSPELTREIPPSPAALSNLNPDGSFVARSTAPPLKSLNLDRELTQKDSMEIFKSPPIVAESSILENSSFIGRPAPVFQPNNEDFTLNSTDSDNCWVTVFGFPPDSASYVLSLFAICGSILFHENASRGNWMHIRYQSALQARQALSKNGQIFDECLRLGVVPCTDKKVRERQVGSPFQMSNRQFTNESFVSMVGSPADLTFNRSKLDVSKSGMRSLAAAYTAADSDFQISGHETPIKSDPSVMTRLWGYVVGQS